MLISGDNRTQRQSGGTFEKRENDGGRSPRAGGEKQGAQSANDSVRRTHEANTVPSKYAFRLITLTSFITRFVGQGNLFDKMQPVQPPLQTKHAEDILPKMLVCGGFTEDLMPKIVLCHDRTNKTSRSRSTSRSPCSRPLVSFQTLRSRI